MGQVIMIRESHWLGITLFVSSFFRFPLQTYGYETNGFVIVVDDDLTAISLEKALARVLQAKSVENWQLKYEMKNFEAAVGRARKTNKIDRLQDFLASKDFLPILIVTGIVPEALVDFSWVVHFQGDVTTIVSMGDVIALFRQDLKENLPFYLLDLENLSTSRWLLDYKEKEIFMSLKFFVGVARVICTWLRMSNPEPEVEIWFHNYMNQAETVIHNQERLQDLYNISLAVRNCILKYLQKEQVLLLDVSDMQHRKETMTIFFDTDFYYFCERDLKEMCRPLTDSVSFLQIKREMAVEGILVSDKTKGNYTVKVELYDPENDEKRRFRLLKIAKEYLLDDSGLLLEEVQELRKMEEEEA